MTANERVDYPPNIDTLMPAHIYDLAIIPAKHAPTKLEFFSNPIGEKLKYRKAPKTEADTNLESKKMLKRLGIMGISMEYDPSITMLELFELWGRHKFHCANCHWIGVPTAVKCRVCPECDSAPAWGIIDDNRCRFEFFIDKKRIFCLLLQAIPTAVSHMTPDPILANADFYKFMPVSSVLTIKPGEKIKATLNWPIRAPKLQHDVFLRAGLICVEYPA